MSRKTLTIAAAKLKQDKAWEAVEHARADLRAAIRNGIPCTNCGGRGLTMVYNYPEYDQIDCLNCEGFGALDRPVNGQEVP